MKRRLLVAILVMECFASGSLVARPVLRTSSASRVVQGVVLAADSLGAPIAGAHITVVGTGRSAFSSQTGHFVLDGAPEGAFQVQVRRIGYRMERYVVDADVSSVRVVLVPSPLRLPDLDVVGVCHVGLENAEGPNAAVFERVLMNVDQIAALEQQFPSEGQYERMTLNVSEKVARVVRHDTVLLSSPRSRAYRTGDVVHRGEVTDPYVLFDAGDVARSDFQEAHCFAFDGADSTGGGQAWRVRFWPAPSVKAADWSGTLDFDGNTGFLRRATVSLSNIPGWSTIRSAECTVEYTDSGSGLVGEQLVHCETLNTRGRFRRVVDGRKLIQRRYTGRSPSG